MQYQRKISLHYHDVSLDLQIRNFYRRFRLLLIARRFHLHPSFACCRQSQSILTIIISHMCIISYNFEMVLRVYQNVLRLEVSVHDAFLVHVN